MSLIYSTGIYGSGTFADDTTPLTENRRDMNAPTDNATYPGTMASPPYERSTVDAKGDRVNDTPGTERTVYGGQQDEEKQLSTSVTPSPSYVESGYAGPAAADPPQPAASDVGPPPDGGAQAWMCVAGSFLMQFVQFGLSESPTVKGER